MIFNEFLHFRVFKYFLATSFSRSQLQPFFPVLEALPEELHNAVPYLLSYVMGKYDCNFYLFIMIALIIWGNLQPK